MSTKKLPEFLRVSGGVPGRIRRGAGQVKIDIDAELEVLERLHKKARGAERDRLLVAALNLLPLPYYWRKAAREALLAGQPSLPKDQWHHHIFRAYLDLRDDDGAFRYGWEEALHLTVEKLKELGVPASETTIKRHFRQIEKTLPEKARRPHTHSRYRRARPLGPK